MPYPMWNPAKTGILVDRGNGVLAFVEAGPEFESLKGSAPDWHDAPVSSPPEPPIDEQRAAMTCSPAQMRVALDDMEAPDDATKTMLDVVEGIVAQDRKASIVWEYATQIVRTSPLIEALGKDFTPEEIDDIFRLAMAVET